MMDIVYIYLKKELKLHDSASVIKSLIGDAYRAERIAKELGLSVTYWHQSDHYEFEKQRIR